MTEKLKQGWTWVAFGDVVRQIKDQVDIKSCGLTEYIRGEHFEPGNISLIGRSIIGDGQHGSAFHMRFRKGDVLYVSRNPQLRKTAVADFDGICANTTYVCRSDSGLLLQELLPFIMQTEGFVDYTIKHKRGSTNFYLNWSDIAPYEFMLPPLEEQRRIIEVLRAGEDHVQALGRLSVAAATLLQATIDEAFTGLLVRVSNVSPRVMTDIGDLPRNWILKPLAAVCSKIVDGVHKRPEYVAQGIPFLTVENLNRGPGIDFSDTRFITREDHVEYYKRANPEKGDVLVSKDGTLGIARVVETEMEFSIFVSIALLKPKRGHLDPWFLRYYFDSSLFRRRLASKSSGSALKHIHLIDFRESIIPSPPLLEQQTIVSAIRRVDGAYRRCLLEEASAKELRHACLAHLMAGGSE